MESCGRGNEIQICIESTEVCGNVGICLISYWNEVFEFWSLLVCLYEIYSCVLWTNWEHEFLICEDEIQTYILRSDFEIVRNFTDLEKGIQFQS